MTGKELGRSKKKTAGSYFNNKYAAFGYILKIEHGLQKYIRGSRMICRKRVRTKEKYIMVGGFACLPL